ncbi:MAG: glycogen synthase [Candidatus Yanofskybacteria bacterium]|nr:glycogen synthase [Candidatus Yanofskybacteria bacterium]
MNNLTKIKKLKILFVAAEAAPFIKVGGLGEVMRSLPRAMKELGHDARLFIPKYAKIEADKFPMELEIGELDIAPNEKDPHGLLVSNVLKHLDKESGITAYFLENMEYYEKRANTYSYGDDTIRWVLLSKGALEFIRRSDWKPDVIIASDWQTGFIPNLIKTEFKDDPVLSKIATIFVIHNLKFQGMFDPHFVPELEADSGQGPIPDFNDPHILKLNGARRGILYADIINTVSPTYAKEILTPEFGEKLEEILREKRDALFGTLNGIDNEGFNPETDPDIPAHYSRSALAGRYHNKVALQKSFGLPEDDKIFVMGFVNRLTEQKGVDLLQEIAPSLFDNLDFQLVIVGTGDTKYRTAFKELQEKYPARVAVHPFFDEKLPKLVFSGADAVLIPSRFEPSGLVQMEAMRYGAIPIVRKTGGLADTVTDYYPGIDHGTGFVFEKYNSYAFLIAIVRAWQAYRNKKEWSSLIKRVMSQDFSWKKSAKDYVKLCHSAINKHQSSISGE